MISYLEEIYQNWAEKHSRPNLKKITVYMIISVLIIIIICSHGKLPSEPESGSIGVHWYHAL